MTALFSDVQGYLQIQQRKCSGLHHIHKRINNLKLKIYLEFYCSYEPFFKIIFVLPNQTFVAGQTSE